MMKQDNRQKTNRSRFGSLLMKAGAAGLLFLMAQSSAWANISYCTARPDREQGDPPKIVDLTISGELFLGPDLPADLSKWVFKLYSQYGETGFSCRRATPGDTTSITLTHREKVDELTTPYGAATPQVIGGNTYNVYPTNVPGIGVSFEFIKGTLSSFTNASFPVDVASTIRTCTNGTSCFYGVSGINVYVHLHKTGDIPIGSHFIDASSFPTFSYSSGALEYPPLDHFATWTFSGGINMVTRTCDVPSSITVDLGEHQKEDFLANRETPWVDFNIELTNCPAFVGKALSHNWSNAIDGNNGIFDTKPANIQTGNRNSISYMLKPTTAILNSLETRVALDTGPGAAEGVSIEIQTPTRTSNMFNRTLTFMTIDPTSSVAGQSYQIPFRARYYREGAMSAIKGGEANTSVEFVITYQ